MVMIPDLVDLEKNLDAPIPHRFQALADELASKHSPEEVRRIVRAVGGTGFNINLFPDIGLWRDRLCHLMSAPKHRLSRDITARHRRQREFLPLFPFLVIRVTALCRHSSSIHDDDH
jgi:hypothetical protein